MCIIFAAARGAGAVLPRAPRRGCPPESPDVTDTVGWDSAAERGCAVRNGVEYSVGAFTTGRGTVTRRTRSCTVRTLTELYIQEDSDMQIGGVLYLHVQWHLWLCRS